jgi:hypothetical protein
MSDLSQHTDTLCESRCKTTQGHLSDSSRLQLAINGTSLVNKVRVVAATLLDSATSTEVLSEGAKRHSHLLDFLNILSEIEKVRKT